MWRDSRPEARRKAVAQPAELLRAPRRVGLLRRSRRTRAPRGASSACAMRPGRRARCGARFERTTHRRRALWVGGRRCPRSNAWTPVALPPGGSGGTHGAPPHGRFEVSGRTCGCGSLVLAVYRALEALCAQGFFWGSCGANPPTRRRWRSAAGVRLWMHCHGCRRPCPLGRRSLWVEVVPLGALAPRLVAAAADFYGVVELGGPCWQAFANNIVCLYRRPIVMLMVIYRLLAASQAGRSFAGGGWSPRRWWHCCGGLPSLCFGARPGSRGRQVPASPSTGRGATATSLPHFRTVWRSSRPGGTVGRGFDAHAPRGLRNDKQDKEQGRADLTSTKSPSSLQPGEGKLAQVAQ